jgi:O-antigen/teichoic acid export membrane protein
MLGSIKISVRDTLIYGLGNVAVKVVGLILIPLYTSPDFFTADDFGIIGLLEICGLVVTAVMASSIPQSLTRYFWDKSVNASQESVFFVSLITQLAVSAAMALLLLPVANGVSGLIFETEGYSNVLRLVIISSAVQSVNNILNTLMRLRSRALFYILTNISKLLVVLSVTLFLVIRKGEGIEGIYKAQIIGNVFFAIILIPFAVKNSAPQFNWSLFKEMNLYGYPLLIANISAVTLNVIDRFSLNSLSLLKFVAVYTLAFKITSVIKLVLVDSVKLAVSPLMFKKAGDADSGRFYSKILLYSSFVIMTGIIAVSVFGSEIIKIINKNDDLISAVYIIPILALSSFFMNMKEIMVYGLHIAKKTKIIGTIVVVTTFLSLGLNILLIPPLDAAGCALATMATQLIYWIIVYLVSQRYYYIPYEKRKILLILITGCILSATGYFLNDISLLPRILIKISIIISFPFILFFLGFYEQIELETIKGFYRKWSDLSKLAENLRSLKFKE